jgi:aconitate hydratase
MFGMPIVIRVPDVIGVRLTGRLPPGVLATDLALEVTHRLREIGVAGEFVEFFGPGVATLTAGDRSVVANMAPEYGATTGYFPIDARTLDYLRDTGRSVEVITRVESYARSNGLWFQPDSAPSYTRTIEINLDRVEMQVAGPRRPQDSLPYWNTAEALEKTVPAPSYPVALAAITSCTNTSDPRLLLAAGLLARKAHQRGLRVPAGVKTSLSPGSPASAQYLRRSGLYDDLVALGFDIVGYGCATCIGNPGPLPLSTKDGAGHRVAILSGNRNFPGRVHPDLDLALIMSPPLVIAFALAGDASRNLRDAPVQSGVMLRDLWPTHDEIEAAYRAATRPDDFAAAFDQASRNEPWRKLAAPEGPRFPWNAGSTILRRPPFASADAGTMLGRYVAHPLLVLGDDVTTDHISPASAIPPDSPTADFLVERGEDRGDLNVFASRRGNWEVMMRGAFYHRSLRNLMAPASAVGQTVHAPSGESLPIWEAAFRYREAGDNVVLVAGDRYGMGSSRDWAAKAQRLLGIRAVLAVGFERIHRSNLIGMGILPLRLPARITPTDLALQPGDRIEIDAHPEALSPRGRVKVAILYRDGSKLELDAIAAVETQTELQLLREGGVIPHILQAAAA